MDAFKQLIEIAKTYDNLHDFVRDYDRFYLNYKPISKNKKERKIELPTVKNLGEQVFDAVYKERVGKEFITRIIEERNKKTYLY